MKILIWVLNSIQFLIVYFLVFWLLHVGIIVYPGPSGLSIEGLWPAISIGIAGIPWRYYKRFSLFITSKKMKAPTEEVVAEEASNNNENKELSQSKTKSAGIFNTLFFGYLSLKWRRLFRTLFILFFVLIPFYMDKRLFYYAELGWSNRHYYSGDSPEILFFTRLHGDTVLIMLLFLFAVALSSWIIKPFVVKD
jgi:hypothetical protein